MKNINNNNYIMSYINRSESSPGDPCGGNTSISGCSSGCKSEDNCKVCSYIHKMNNISVADCSSDKYNKLEFLGRKQYLKNLKNEFLYCITHLCMVDFDNYETSKTDFCFYNELICFIKEKVKNLSSLKIIKEKICQIMLDLNEQLLLLNKLCKIIDEMIELAEKICVSFDREKDHCLFLQFESKKNEFVNLFQDKKCLNPEILYLSLMTERSLCDSLLCKILIDCNPSYNCDSNNNCDYSYQYIMDIMICIDINNTKNLKDIIDKLFYIQKSLKEEECNTNIAKNKVIEYQKFIDLDICTLYGSLDKKKESTRLEIQNKLNQIDKIIEYLELFLDN